MTYWADAQRGIVAYTGDQWPALEAFRARSYPPQARQCSRAYVEWMFGKNPASAGDCSIWFCVRNGEITGQQGGIPVALQIGPETCRGSWAVDLLVDASWRMRGIGPILSATHTASCDVALALGVTDPAWKAYKRAGWIDLGRLRVFFRPLDFHGLSEIRPLKSPWLRNALRTLNPVLKGLDLLALGLGRVVKRGYSLIEIGTFDARVDKLWESIGHEYPVIVRRDLRWLRWRFDSSPDRERYRRAYLMKNGHVAGYIVFRIVMSKGQRIAIVVDYLASVCHYPAFFTLALVLMRRCGAVAVTTAMMNDRADRMLHQLGFLHKDELGAAQRFMIKPSQRMADKLPILQRPENWFVTLADSDLEIAFG